MGNINAFTIANESRIYPAIAKADAVTARCEVHGGRHECSKGEDKVTLSADAKALSSGNKADDDMLTYENMKTFTAAALGMDHPQEAAAIDDAAYDAGQMVKAATTLIGLGMLL